MPTLVPYRPLPLREELIPFLLDLEMLGENEEEVGLGPVGLADEAHAGFFRGTVALAVVAGFASAHQILPGMLAAPVAGDDVVQGQIPGLQAAVLAREIVSDKDLLAAETELWPRPMNQVDQAYDRGQRNSAAGGAQKPMVVFQDLRLAPF
jgi:hypothetical protein